MSAWLDPLRRTLDRSPQAVDFFFRDDDVGWSDERLFALLDPFAIHDLPIDLAVIPAALTPHLAARLGRWAEARSGRIGFHQHGLAHVNHEATGRKCEFGQSRSARQVATDLVEGQRLLQAALGDLLDPIFTPPWNRCSATTATVLVDLQYPVLSRDSSATPFDLPALTELPIQVDWLAHRHGVRLTLNDLGERLAARAVGPAAVGVMFHHAVMDNSELERIGELLALARSHDRAHCHRMIDLIGPKRQVWPRPLASLTPL